MPLPRSISRILSPWLISFALLPLASAQDKNVSLSVSFDLDEPSVLLFPGQSATAEVQVIAHPSEAAVWKGVQMRFVARQAADGSADKTTPVGLVALHAGSRRRLSISPDKWYYANYFGLGQHKGTLAFEVTHKRTSETPVELFAEVDSATADRGSTAPFQIRCADIQLVDLRDLTSPGDDDTIADGDTAWLTHYEADSSDVPIMPRLEARIEGLPTEYTVHWLMQSRYGRRGDRDKIQFPEKGWLDVAGDEAWKAYATYHDRYFGGEAKLSFKIQDDNGDYIHAGSRPFQIKCRNPRDESAKAYIKKTQGEEFWFAWAISQHESRQNRRVFNQFNSGGSIAYEPNFGPPDGWGIFQIDSARGAEVTTDEVWDWRVNIQAGLDELKTAKRDTKKYFDAIKKTYPSKWEEPPKTYKPPGTKTTLTGEEASIMQLYNGAAVVRKLKNRYNTWSYYRSCWQFYPGNPSGKRWKFIKNRNNYVYKVVHHEIEGDMPIEE